MPRISVIMAVYNGMPYLRHAVGSILEQSEADLELIIVDDNSTDQSPRYLAAIQNPSVKLIRLSRNRGQGTARNVALQYCTGEFVAIMDADDISLPTRISKQVSFLERHPRVGAVGTQFTYIGADGRRGFGAALPLRHENIYASLIRGNHAFVHSSMLTRTALMRKMGGYRISGCGEDYDLLLRIGETSELANLDELLYLYRAHYESTNIIRTEELRRRYQHTSECARCRTVGKKEPSFEEFVKGLNAQSFWKEWNDKANTYALKSYRRAISEILGNQIITGYARLAWAASLSPALTLRRVSRQLKRNSHS